MITTCMCIFIEGGLSKHSTLDCASRHILASAHYQRECNARKGKSKQPSEAKNTREIQRNVPKEAVWRIANSPRRVEHVGNRSRPQKQSLVKESCLFFIFQSGHFHRVHRGQQSPQLRLAIALHHGSNNWSGSTLSNQRHRTNLPRIQQSEIQ